MDLFCWIIAAAAVLAVTFRGAQPELSFRGWVLHLAGLAGFLAFLYFVICPGMQEVL